MSARLDFRRVADEALSHYPALLFDWLPGGRLSGQEYLAINPCRVDRSLGSFSINVKTGRWCDFSSGDRGGDAISLYAYLHNLSQSEAARELAQQLGVSLG